MREYQQITPFVFNCSTCPTPCDGKSKMTYLFENDAQFSEYYEQKIIDYINQKTPFKAQKTTEAGYPDLEISNSKNEKFYIEIKVQRRTFMSVEKVLPDSGLKPSETVALNLSDLLRYFEIEGKEKVPVFILWVLLNRPCVLGQDEEQYYYRLSSELKEIWVKENNKRRFRRKSGDGDEVDGKHLGVTVNYHFSLKELKQWLKS